MSRLLVPMMIAGLLAAAPLQPAQAATEGWSSMELVGIDGKPFEIATLRDHVVLVVNVASFCSYTTQYADLQNLFERFRDKGLVVLGVPCNQFGGQEPGSNAEIKNFCKSRYGVSFPLLAKQDVNGSSRSPLYTWLVTSYFKGTEASIGWNFEKFLVDRKGSVIGHFGSHVHPKDPQLLAAIELALASGS